MVVAVSSGECVEVVDGVWWQWVVVVGGGSVWWWCVVAVGCSGGWWVVVTPKFRTPFI